MYHLYKAYGDPVYEKRLTDSFRQEKHVVTTQYSSLVTLSPSFFRNELEIGMSVLGIMDDIEWSDLSALDILVINPLLDLLHVYAEVDPQGAKLAAEEMKQVLMTAEECEDFSDKQIRLIEHTAKK